MPKVKNSFSSSSVAYTGTLRVLELDWVVLARGLSLSRSSWILAFETSRSSFELGRWFNWGPMPPSYTSIKADLKATRKKKRNMSATWRKNQWKEAEWRTLRTRVNFKMLERTCADIDNLGDVAVVVVVRDCEVEPLQLMDVWTTTWPNKPIRRPS